ncbi:hypothetical protein CTU88_00560 [Streptomyces sp. JV178]|nr:hypothetical protein CTU88_00560 [Streptomyces sp. JV178]
MPSLAITWTLGSHGWAVVKVADDHGEAEAARSAIRAFDRIDHEQGEEAYGPQWGRPFPRTELEALRTAMRSHQSRRRSLSSGP